mgnify:FL=1
MDLLQQLKGISIDLSSGNLISVPNGEVLHEVTDVFINENLSIPYRAEVFYCAEVTINTEDDLLFQPNKSFMEKYNVSLSSGVVNVYQKTIPVRFVNFDIKNTEIKPNTKIGTITKVQQAFSTKLKSCDVKKYDKPTVNSPNLTSEERKRFTKLLRKYDHLFAKHE